MPEHSNHRSFQHGKESTHISRFVAAVEDQPVVVGLDIHKKIYSVTHNPHSRESRPRFPPCQIYRRCSWR
jgi:hypothetical protein